MYLLENVFPYMNKNKQKKVSRLFLCKEIFTRNVLCPNFPYQLTV